MDEQQRLSALLRAATDDVPPAGFDHADVVSASRRITARRHRIAGMTAGLVGVVAAGGILAAVLAGAQDGATSAAQAPAASSEVQTDGRGGRAAAPAPPADAARQCVSDPKLAVDVAAAVRSATGGGAMAVEPVCRATGRGFEVSRPEGVVRVVIDPTDSITALPPGAQTLTIRTASGQSLTVSIFPTPAGRSLPAETLASVANALAPRY